MMQQWRVLPKGLFFLTALTAGLTATAVAEPGEETADTVSFYKQVRPIVQARCQGCHQPAKQSGEYVMTSFDRLLAGGESSEPAIVPGKLEDSYLWELITPMDGHAEMPAEGKPLTQGERDLIRQWILDGAHDDTPANAVQRYDVDHPPQYSRLPVVTSLDFSPDSDLLAVAGFHEVLLHKADGSELVGRLVGLSERIESVCFSPDGKRLAVTGGLPARMGEVQIWDVATRELLLSVPVTFDTVYGGTWSPDGKLVAFGCADNSLRVIDADSGKQVLYQGAHSDWVRDAVFSNDGKHLISAGRDMTVKLTEVATQRFVDNITSITPGALKGGVTSVARHPERDEIVIGGSDGVPKVYRIFRQTNRVIGDDANLIRRLPALRGRVFDVAVSYDGKRIVAGSSLDGQGEVAVYSYEFDTTLPDNIKKILAKRVAQWKPEEKAAVEKYWTADVHQIAKTEIPECGIYAVAFRPDGQSVAVAGADGRIRLIDATTGKISKTFGAAPLSNAPLVAAAPGDAAVASETIATRLPDQSNAAPAVVALQVEPQVIRFNRRSDYCQLLVTGELPSGERRDVTRSARFELPQQIAQISVMGFVKPIADGQSTLTIHAGGQRATIRVSVSGMELEPHADFIADVNPVLSRLGCNQGTCHGAAKGKNGFKLSLRGYDSLLDVRSFTDDLASRRVNRASPDDSLMLLKATGAVPHMGGQLIQPQSDYYQTIRSWIADGARLVPTTSRVASIAIQPEGPVIQRAKGQQQVRIIATYADGVQRDVTREAFCKSGNTEVAVANESGLITAIRRGEAPLLARFEGAYAATTLTVMGDRSQFVWHEPPSNNRIDELTAAKWKRLKIQPSELCNDTEFLRRVYLDLTGLPPTADQVTAFMADDRNTMVKRNEIIDRLIGSEDYIEHWSNKWADLLQVNRKFLGPEGAAMFRAWIREQVASNRPYDAFVRDILTANGSNRENPPASYFKILRTPQDTMENTTQLFLAVRFSCNKCHDHPFERWTQDQYYQTAAYFAQVSLKRDPESGKRTIGGTAVEGAKPLYEIVQDAAQGEVLHDRTKQVAPPQFPFPCKHTKPKQATRRQELANWLTSPDNRYFAKSYVNRLWGYLFGIGIIEPIDDIRASNPPSNPELLEYLTAQFIESGFNIQAILKQICQSRTYQLSVAPNRWNEDDRINFSHAVARRLPAEVLYDAIQQVTGSQSKFPGVPPGTRAAALPDSGVKLPSGFLATFGRPSRDSACECDRSNQVQLGPVMALVSGPTLSDAIADPKNELARLVADESDDRALIDRVFLRILNRPVTDRERAIALQSMSETARDHRALQAAVKKRESEVTARRPELEKIREQNILAAQTALAQYEKELAPKLIEREKEKAARTVQLEQTLLQYEATLEKKLADWETRQSAVAWTPLKPTTLKATNDATLTIQDDLSIFASGKNGKGAYEVVANSELKRITAIRLELLTDKRLPKNGPGRAGGGNCVLTELTVKTADPADPKTEKAVALKNALADFSQDRYSVASAVDGQTPDINNGWAIAPNTGVMHWATFELAEPLDCPTSATLHLLLNQQYRDKTHSIGRFRISVADVKRPVGLSLPDPIEKIVATPRSSRTEEQTAALTAFFRQQDIELKKKQAAVAESKKPLPIDPELKRLKEDLQYVQRPIPEDAVLKQLRQDLAESEKQLKHRRLTAMQDLAWALMNSPAFLFNH